MTDKRAVTLKIYPVSAWVPITVSSGDYSVYNISRPLEAQTGHRNCYHLGMLNPEVIHAHCKVKYQQCDQKKIAKCL